MPTTSAPTQADPRPFRKRALRALEVQIEPVPLAGTYKFAIGIVALAMLILPLIYFGLVVLFTFGAYWHAVHHRGLIGSLPGPLGLIAYVLPIVIGPVVAAFMVKPFFVRRAWRQHPQRLKREAEPFLFEYVERVCRAVGSPVPNSIRVTSEVNAAAGFRRGLLSLFGRDMTLIVGLPLVSGLTLRQLTGILAHEFGHFAQGAGMRLMFLIQTVNAWFGRVALERDAWDDWLVYNSRYGDVRLRPFLYVARFFVWLNRALMWGIMMLGHVISSYVSREQEFDADRYTCRLVGSDAVGPTLRRTTELGVAFEMAIADLRQFWDEGRLADNLPKLLVANLDQMTPELKKELAKRAREAETGLFDTHPADRERAAAVREEPEPGVFRMEPADENQPATVLFSDFDKLSRVATLQFYRENIHSRIQPSQLHPVDALIERQKAEIEAGKSLHRYFQTRIPVLRPLPLADDAGQRPEDPEAAGMVLTESRERMLAELTEYKEVSERYSKAESRLFDITGASALLQANLRIRPSEFGLTQGTKREAAEKSRTVRAALDNLAARLLPFEEQAGRRLSAALRLLQLTRIQKRIPDGDLLQREVAGLLPEAQFVSGLMAELPTFRILVHGVMVLFSNFQGNEQNPNLVRAIISRMEAIHTRLESLHAALGDQLYPFDHAKADMTLREYVLPHVPDKEEFGDIHRATEQMFEKLVTVQIRLFARLALAAEKVESALGLPRLPDPEEQENKMAKRKRRRSSEEDGS